MKRDRELELLARIEELESELEASLCREDKLINNGSSSSIVDKVKNSSFGRIALSPTSVLGKIVRFPRSVVRIVMHPSILRDIYGKKKNKLENLIYKNVRMTGVPLETIRGYNPDERVNVVVLSLGNLKSSDIEAIMLAIEYAKKHKAILRIITLSDENKPDEFRKMSEQKGWPVYDKIEFYSSKTQREKNEKKMRLEVGPNDIFINLVRGI